MKTITSILLTTMSLTICLYAGESKIYPILGPATLMCCGQNLYSVDVENINPIFAIENISGRWVVTRQSQIIHMETSFPREVDLEPGETSTFVLEIPMELLLLDGLIEIAFEFLSDFDLNTDPTAGFLSVVDGCGINKDEVIDFLLDAYLSTAEEYEAYMFLYDQLLKPGTIIRGSHGESWSTALEAFTWLMLIFDPYAMFEQEVKVVLLDANTLDVSEIPAKWIPLVNDVIFAPDRNAVSRIYPNTVPQDDPPPFPFTHVPVPDEPADSVCAILVEGYDDVFANLQEAMATGVEHMKLTLNNGTYGPKLPEANILVRKCTDGYTKDSLIQDLKALKNKYKKVYFYYAGHGTAQGHMCTGVVQNEWITYAQFVDELLHSGAKQYCIMVDACYSGQLIDEITSHPGSIDKDIEVITGADNSKEGSVKIYDDGMVKTTVLKFSQHIDWAMQIMPADANSDGKISFAEAYRYIIGQNRDSIVMAQNPQILNRKNYSMMKWGDIMVSQAIDVYGDDVIDRAIARIFPEVLPLGTEVVSFDKKDVLITPPATVFGWLELYGTALYGKPVLYCFIDANTGAATFINNIEFWPTIPSVPEFSPFDPKTVYQNYTTTNYGIGLPPSTIHEDIILPIPDSPNVALIISGYHADPIAQIALNTSAQIFYDNLIGEDNQTYAFHPDHVRLVNAATKPEISSIIDGLNTTGKNAVIYYSGNIRSDGKIALGQGPEDWETIEDFLQTIASMQATSYTFVVDANYSGLFVEKVKQNNVFQPKQLNMLTAADDENLVDFTIHVDENMVFLTAYTTVTNNFMTTYGNPVGGHTDLWKTWFKNFKQSLVDQHSSKPVGLAMREEELSSTVEDVVIFNDLDLQIETHIRSAVLTIKASEELRFIPQTSSSMDVFEISPVRRWELTSNEPLDPLLTGSILFHYDPGIDSLVSNEGILGIVRRNAPDEDWQAHYPVEYDSEEQMIIAKEVDLAGEWAIARVRSSSGVDDHIEGLDYFSVFPNPVKGDIHFTISVSDRIALSFDLTDIHGRCVDKSESEVTFEVGTHTHTMRLEDQPHGIYVLRVGNQERSACRLILIQ